MSKQGESTSFLLKVWQRFVAACQRVQAFQDRAWIVSIQNNLNEQDTILKDTFVVSEDSFSSSMSWMHNRGYTAEMINKVDKMKRSQVINLCVNGQSHSLIRVK